jgi:hypothetical protein
MGMGNRTKVDMSPEAVTARLKRVCGLGDAERRATMIRSLINEIKPEKQLSKKPNDKKQNKDASIRT